jgi:hypothetical protein
MVAVQRTMGLMVEGAGLNAWDNGTYRQDPHGRSLAYWMARELVTQHLSTGDL